MSYISTWLWVKNRYPKWNPSKWKHGPKPAVPLWFNFDPYPHPASTTTKTVQGTRVAIQPDRAYAALAGRQPQLQILRRFGLSLHLTPEKGLVS